VLQQHLLGRVKVSVLDDVAGHSAQNLKLQDPPAVWCTVRIQVLVRSDDAVEHFNSNGNTKSTQFGLTHDSVACITQSNWSEEVTSLDLAQGRKT